MSISRVSARCFRALVPSQRQSTLASVPRAHMQPVGSMGTWTDRLKRWQSGGQGDKKVASLQLLTFAYDFNEWVESMCAREVGEVCNFILGSISWGIVLWVMH